MMKAESAEVASFVEATGKGHWNLDAPL